MRFESAEQFKAVVWSLAMRCGLESAGEVILLGDGAARIGDHIGSVLGERTICITDWYHVIEHLWSCGNTLFGQGTPEASQWVEPREALLWKDVLSARRSLNRESGKIYISTRLREPHRKNIHRLIRSTYGLDDHP